MSATHGSMNYIRFFVVGDVPAPEAIEKGLEARAFVPLSPSAEMPEVMGWVTAEKPDDHERKLTRADVIFGTLILVAVREDRWVIPRDVVKRLAAKRAKKIAADEGYADGVDGISRTMMKAIETAIVAELRNRLLPRSKVAQVVWDTKLNEIRVFGRGTFVRERVASLFERTFGVALSEAHPAKRAALIALDPKNRAVLARLSPNWLFPEAMGTTTITMDNEE